MECVKIVHSLYYFFYVVIQIEVVTNLEYREKTMKIH